ncbi:hypothetical protein E5D57_012394 [Metarhizium anisopliae]|nr:hypothetical protein E5D57_012394 [Metarhizium anisopliae]
MAWEASNLIPLPFSFSKERDVAVTSNFNSSILSRSKSYRDSFRAMKMRLESSELYTIGWITALHIERAAATAFLDDVHESPERFEQNASDQNSYTWGRMGKHNIVIVSLPEGTDGTAAAATTTLKLLSSLPQIRIGLLVGIGGGVAQPHKGQDIRLGDIVVGKPEGKYGGVVQYDHGKALRGPAWQRKGMLNKPPAVLLYALSHLKA